MQLTATVVTDAGMHLVWDRAHFAGVRDYDTWSKELEEDQAIRDHIVAGHIVPINIHRDGSFTLTVRVESTSMPKLSEAEELHVAERSEPYRFACQGHVDVSGIEYVHAEAGRLVHVRVRGEASPGEATSGRHSRDALTTTSRQNDPV